MNVVLSTCVALGAVGGLLVLMVLVRRVAAGHGWGAEVQRKLVHVATGLFAMTLPWLFAEDWPVYLTIGLALVAMMVLRLPGVAETEASIALHGVERRSYGDFLLAGAVGLLFLLSDRQPVLYLLPLAVLTLADAAAALAGSAYGRRFYEVEDGTKSVEGSMIFLLVTLVISMIGLLLLSDIPRVNVVVLSLMVAGFGALVEADSWRGFDNFFLPMGLWVFLATTIDRTPESLILLMVTFLLAILAVGGIAATLGLTRHAARVYVVAIFLILSVTALQNAVLPVLVLIAHAMARRVAPGQERFPDLDAVAALALVSFGWLALGRAAGPNALLYYGMTCAALTLGLTAISARALYPPLRMPVISVTAVVLLVLWAVLSGFNPAVARWSAGTAGLAIGALALTAAAGLWQPTWFHQNRMGKLSVVALLVPVAAYGYLAMQYGGAS